MATPYPYSSAPTVHPSGQDSALAGHLSDCIDRMEAIMVQAKPLMTADHPENAARLKMLRLQMAGAITSFQVALDRIATDATTTPAQAEVAHRSSAAWTALGSEFRAFTLLNQSASPQRWDDYLTTGIAFMKRIKAEIQVGRRLFC